MAQRKKTAARPKPKDVDGSRESLRFKYLPDEEIDYLSHYHPEILRPGWCPTCGGKRKWKEKVRGPLSDCDCEMQRMLYAHFLSAGIPPMYMRLTWKDFSGSIDILKSANDYINNLDRYMKADIGYMLTGANGVGKTLLMSLILKDAICFGYSSYFIAANDLTAMYTDGWSNEETKERFDRKVKNSKILVIDDVGKEYTNSLTKQTFESLVRHRVQSSLVTMVSSNMTEEQMRATYGQSFVSLIDEGFIKKEVRAEDYRPQALQTKIDEAKAGIVRRVW